MGKSCPGMVAGTTVRAVDIDGGAALEFTTTGDVAEVRRRAAHMAEMHAKHGTNGGMADCGMMGGGMMGSGTGMHGMHGGMGTQEPPAAPSAAPSSR